MTAGQDRDLPDFTGGSGFSASSGGGVEDPYAPSAATSDPYASAASDPYASPASDPYAVDQVQDQPWAEDPYAGTSPAGGTYGAGGPYGADAQGYGPWSHRPGAQAPYGPPVQGGFGPPPESSNAAIAGLVLGILALSMCSGLTSPFGIFFALKGMRETDPTATAPKGGRGLAVAGLVCSLVGILPLLLLLFYVVVMGLGIALELSS